MHCNCNEVRERLLAGKVDAVIDAHIAECAECSALRNTVLGLNDLAKSWQDEPVPHWQRVPEEMRRRRGTATWLMWAPLAACLVMCLLVVARTHVQWNDQGFQVSFGAAPQQEQIDQAYVDQALAQMRDQSNEDMTRLLARFHRGQQAHMDKVINDLAAANRQERRQDLQTVADNWQEQREEDLKTLERQINLLINRQNRNSDNLYQLASYVNRRD